jgi:RNA polymerase sigma factor (sigma-70 family)
METHLMHKPAAIKPEKKLAEQPPRAAGAVTPLRQTDGERLMRFWRHKDEAAFAAIVKTHAPLVWGVCSQVLKNRQDVEDAFQATFLILARKAKSIRSADSVAGWLYRVAFRTALLAKDRGLRRFELPLLDDPVSDDDQQADLLRREQCIALLEELHALPARYCEPLVLCYFEGRSRHEAAEQLGVTRQTVKGRVARGMRILRSRMVRRGLTLTTTLAVTRMTMSSAQAATTPALVSKTVATSIAFAAKGHLLKTVAMASSKGAAGASYLLAEKGILAMTIAAVSKPAVGVLGVCLAAGTLAVASADRPTGGGYNSTGGAATMLIADADDSNQALAAIADEDKASVVKEAAEETKAKAAEAATEAAAVKEAAEADAAKAAKKASAAAKKVNAASKKLSGAERDDGLKQAPRLTVVASAAAGSADNPFAGPDWPNGSQNVQFQYTPVRSAQLQERRVNRESLKMEGEYWSLKAEGLQKKAEALEMKAQGLKEAGSRQEALEAEADAKLAAAEVKMSQINSRRIQDQLKAAGAGDLKSGSKGPQVSALQQLLNAKLKPSPELTVDGDFGPLTEQAVKDFQKKKKLETTGVVDDKTADALGLNDSNPFGFAPGLATYGRAAAAGTPPYTAVFTPVPKPTLAAPPSAPATPIPPVQAVIAAPPSQAIISTDQLSKLKQQVDELQKAKKTLEEQVKKLKGDEDRYSP